jgi:putative ABC transport system permease protein
MLLRWALRELGRSWRMSLFFVLNLSLGLTGFIVLEAYKNALQDYVQLNRQKILGGDIAISARRELAEDELAAVKKALPDFAESTTYEFFAMVASGESSRLVRVNAVDDQYPLYGGMIQSDGQRMAIDSSGIWLYPELEQQLSLKKGDMLKLGNLTLPVKEFIAEDSTQTFRSASIAPQVFIHRDLLDRSGLIQFGSTYSKTRLYRLPPEVNPKTFQDALYKEIKDPVVSVETAEDAGDDSGRQMGYLSDFLGLVALIALFLAALGAAYIWRLFLQQRMKDIAILRSLGLDGTKAVFLYVIEAAILGILAIVPAVVCAQILFPILNRFLSSMTSFDLQPFLSWSSVLMGMGLSLGTSLLVALPFLLRLREIRPAKLFSEEKFNPDLQIQRPWAFLPAIAVLWGLAVVQSNSFFTGSLFTAALFAVLALLALSGWLLLRSIANIKSGPWDIRQGLKSAGRRRIASLSVFLALGLGSLLMNILPQIKVSLQQELQSVDSKKVPSLFLFDIQDEQVPVLNEMVAAQGVSLVNLSPMIRARVLKVNGEDYERKVSEGGFKTREEERELRFRNRGVNLSYRSQMSDSETLEEGRPFSGRWDANSGKRPELSVEFRYAERLGLKVGDVLIFDVQGVEIEGEIVNLRKVRWTSFQPNFFVLLQDGVLDDAPKTWIAGVPNLPQVQKDAMQTELAKRLTNVSVIDVARTVNEVLKVADQMSWSLELMAGLALLTGAVVLFSIARSQIRSRRWELNLIKILGASPSRVRRYLLAEFAVLAGLSSLVGSLLSLLVSGVLLWQMFEGGFTVHWGWVLGTSAFVTLLGIVVAERASASVVKEKPIRLLRQD